MRDPTLQATALRFAAADLSPAESEAFEARLATDEAAQDALAEAVRLSAAAIGQAAPAPHRSFRDRVRARVRGYRGHPLAWSALGAVAVAVAAVVGLQLTPPAHVPEIVAAPVESPEVAVSPEPRAVVAVADDAHHPTTAEIWAELSTPEHVEKAHDDEIRRRQRMRDIHTLHPTKPTASLIDAREP